MVAYKENPNTFTLFKQWFDFAAGNRECKAIHTALYAYIIDLNNRLKWLEVFQLASHNTMEVLSIGNWNTYNKAKKDLIDWGFIDLIEEAKNQHQACYISLCLCRNEEAEMKKHCKSTAISNEAIIKPLNLENPQIVEEEKILLVENDFETFEEAWDLYKESINYKVFADKFKISRTEIEDRFTLFWNETLSFETLNFTKKECFNHFFRWYPKHIKGEEENAPRLAKWKTNLIKIPNEQTKELKPIS